MLRSRTQKWWAIGAGLSVVLLAATWFVMVSPRRSTAAELDLQTENLQAQTSQQQVRTAQLKAALAQLPKKKAELAAIKAQLPPVADIPRTITDLEGFATSAGVTLDQVTPGTPAVAGGTAGAVSTAAATASQPVLVQIPVSMQTTGDYFESSLFLKSLQSTMSRAILVQSIQVAGSANSAPTTTTTTTTTTAGTGTATPIPSAVATAPAASAAKVSMTITGQLFVLLDGSNTLAKVKKDAAKAAS